jgi:hypothetical protein
MPDRECADCGVITPDYYPAEKVGVVLCRNCHEQGVRHWARDLHDAEEVLGRVKRPPRGRRGYANGRGSRGHATA